MVVVGVCINCCGVVGVGLGVGGCLGTYGFGGKIIPYLRPRDIACRAGGSSSIVEMSAHAWSKSSWVGVGLSAASSMLLLL